MAHMEKDPQSGKWYLSDNWHVDDVLTIDDSLSEDDCVNILSNIADSFDANDGINWDVIEFHVEEYKRGSVMLEKVVIK